MHVMTDLEEFKERQEQKSREGKSETDRDREFGQQRSRPRAKQRREQDTADEIKRRERQIRNSDSGMPPAMPSRIMAATPPTAAHEFLRNNNSNAKNTPGISTSTLTCAMLR